MKKLLALVLALVMSMSLVTISNAAFSDAKDIEYTEAVEVMNAIGVLKGTGSNNFEPKATLTREQAAKIISYMLLGDVADKLGTTATGFSDVAADRWSAPFVAYCASNGIIAGVGDGKFDPAGTLTGHAFGKMLLVALGIEGTYTGADWAVNVSVNLVDNKLTDGITGLVLSNGITREEASQMAFNALFFSKTTEKKDVYTIVAGTIDTADQGIATVNGQKFDSFSEAYLVASNAKKGTDTFTISKTNTEVKADSLADKVFKLSSADGTDAFGRPCKTYDSTKKGLTDLDIKVVDEADYVIEGAIKNKDLYSKVGYKAAKEYDWANYLDGRNASNAALKPVKDGSGDFQNTANGTVAYVYVDSDDKAVTFSVVNTYIGEVKKVTDAKDGDKRFVTLTNGKTFETEDFAKKDVVLYTDSKKVTTSPATEGIQSMALAEVVTGKLTKYTTGSSTVLTIGGVDYKVSAQGSTSITDAKLDKEVSVYVDAQGFIMKDKSAADSTKSYVMVLANGAAKSNDDYQSGVTTTVEVYGVNNAGEVVTYKADQISGVTLSTVNVNDLKNKLYTYETDDDGNYELTEVSNAVATADIAVRATKVNYNGTSAILNSDTQFIFVEQKGNGNLTVKTVSVKTGNAALGTAVDVSATPAYVAAEDGVAKYVYIAREFEDSASETSAVAYVDVSTGKKSTTKEDSKTTTIWTYDAYSVDGKISVTQKATAQLSADALYKLNDDNTIGAVVTTTSGVITKIEGSVIMIGSTALNVVDETKEIYVGDDAALAVGQSVVYKTGTDTKATNIETIVVTADQETVKFELGTVSSGYTATTTAYELIKGAGVENEVEIKVTGDFTSATSVTLAGADTAQHNLTTEEKVNGTITLTYTFTAPSADVAANVTVAP